MRVPYGILVTQNIDIATLLTKLLKKSRWPKLYYTEIRVYNRPPSRAEMQKIPFLLPHDLIESIFAHVRERVLNKDGIDPYVRNELEGVLPFTQVRVLQTWFPSFLA